MMAILIQASPTHTFIFTLNSTSRITVQVYKQGLNIFDVIMLGVETGFKNQAFTIFYFKIMMIYCFIVDCNQFGAKINWLIQVAAWPNDYICDLVHVGEDVHFNITNLLLLIISVFVYFNLLYLIIYLLYIFTYFVQNHSLLICQLYLMIFTHR